MLFVEAASGGVSATLSEVLACAEFEPYAGDPLGAIEHLLGEAAAHGIEITPSPARVELDTSLVLRRVAARDAATVGRRIQNLVAAGELVDVECKSSLWLDVKRWKHNPGETPANLKSSAVCHSSMKSICGFLNEEGGTLLIGIAPDMSAFGLESEFFVACPNDHTIDGWLLTFRSAVFQFFHSPEEVWSQIRTFIGDIDGKNVALVEVVPRRKLSVCRCSAIRDFKIYSRRGSSTEEVDPTFIEQYITSRNARIRAAAFSAS